MSNRLELSKWSYSTRKSVEKIAGVDLFHYR